MKKLIQLPMLVLAALLSLSALMAASAQDASPEASPSADLGSPVEALECWSDEPTSENTGYPQYPGVP